MDMVEVIIGKGLRGGRMAEAILPEFETAHDRYLKKLEENVHKQVFKIKGGPRNKIAWLTGAFEGAWTLGAIIVHGFKRQRDLFNPVGYAKIIEDGIQGTSYTARPVAATAVEVTDAAMERELDQAGRRVERKFKN